MNYELELNIALKKLKDIELALNESSIVAITDNQGIIQFANDKFCKISQFSQEELIGSNQNIVNSNFHPKSFFIEMWRTIGAGEIWKGEIKNRAKDGSIYWVDTTIVPFLNESKKPYQYIAIRHEITTRKQYEEKIEQMAFYDPLTSLPNRNLLSKWMAERIEEQDEHFTVLFLDLDRFKTVNDNFGHHIGDLIIKETAQRLQTCLRNSDFISRQGGDEFIIILNRMDNKLEVEALVKKINEEIAFPFYISGKQITISTSIGVSRNTFKGREEGIQPFFEMLIKQADTAMYHAKEQGGNTHCFNTETQNSEMERYYQIELEIRNGLDQEQFSIAYQPLMDLGSNQIVGVEALLRWNHPVLGSVPPNEFIPILEELGLIVPVGKRVLKSVCEQLMKWREQGVLLQRASVNVSPIQFRNPHFVSDLKEILIETQMEAPFLELEITEGTILNIKESMKILDELKELGVKIAIDDFGTGYSSLNYLKRLSLDTVKIDKSFIHDLDFDSEIIVNTIIFMGQNLNFKVLAEGVETTEQLAYLKENNCHEGQGYFWSHPVSEAEIIELYQNAREKTGIAFAGAGEFSGVR